MATAKTRSRFSRRWLWLVPLVAILLGVAWLAWGDGLRKTGGVGSAYAARVGCSCRFVAGRSLAANSQRAARVIGWAVAVAAVLFVITDYLETVLQFIQLLQDRGVDWMAATAGFAQPIKVAAWIATFVGVIAGWGAVRLGGVQFGGEAAG